jgi:hypothetical protein
MFIPGFFNGMPRETDWDNKKRSRVGRVGFFVSTSILSIWRGGSGHSLRIISGLET